MALGTPWQTVATGIGTVSTSVYTIPNASTAPYGAYARDLVLANSGTVTIFASFGTAATSAATVSSFQIPPSGTVVLTQCQVPGTGVVYVQGAATGATCSVGFASNVFYV